MAEESMTKQYHYSIYSYVTTAFIFVVLTGVFMHAQRVPGPSKSLPLQTLV